MQEEIEERTVRLAITGTRMSVRAIVAAAKLYLRHRAHKKLKKDDHIQGKQSIDQLVKQNQGVTSAVIGDEGIKTFERIAKKYGVDFAVVKDKSQDPPLYTAFFKARDTDALDAVLNEYGRKMVKKKSRPSVRQRLKHLIAKAKTKPNKEKAKKKEKIHKKERFHNKEQVR